MTYHVRHIILTRFNSVLDKEFTKALDSSWIKERWELFARYTVPSLLGQSCQNFYWVIEFHPESPAFLKLLIQTAGWPSHFIASFGERERVAHQLRLSECDLVLTSRIDSDDAFHKDAVVRIQSANLACDVLNFEHGFQCDHETGCLALMHRHCSPFSTKVNRRSRGDDLFDLGGEHAYLSQKYSYTDISGGDPMFVQVLHGKNIGNGWYGNPFNNRTLSSLLLRRCFNVEQSDFPLAKRMMMALRLEMLRVLKSAKRALLNNRR